MTAKKVIIRALSALVLLSMLFCMFACGNGEDNSNDPATPPAADGEFAFGKESYGKDFNVLYPNTGIYKSYFFGEACDGSDNIRSALQERAALVEHYLGVNVKGVPVNGYDDIATAVSTSVTSGDDSYQLVLTHSYLGITSLVTNGYLTDFYDFDDIDIEADHWNLDAMEALEIGGKAYLALSDFMISDPTAVFFNKGMATEYQVEDLYKVVRDGKWTLEYLMQTAAKVSVSGNQSLGKEGTYGFAAMADWPFLSLVDSCNVEWLVDNGGYKTLNMSSANKNYLDLYNQVEALADASWSYLYNYNDNANSVTIADGRFLFTFDSLKNAYTYRSSDVKVGILPYPKLTAEQEQYRSFDWSGMMCVPTTVDTDEEMSMVGKTLECLAYYSKDTIQVAYYEKLLCARLAEAPDDAEMIDTYIFDNIVLNPTINFIGKANTPLGILVYTIPKMLRAKLNGTTIETITTNWASNKKAAQIAIETYVNK